MPGKHSREKGKRGEREAAKALTAILGVPVTRSVQYSGKGEGPSDVVGIPGLHVEVKRTERFRSRESLDQAISDSNGEDVPIVLTRAGGEDWRVFLRLKDLPRLGKIMEELRDDQYSLDSADGAEASDGGPPAPHGVPGAGG